MRSAIFVLLFFLCTAFPATARQLLPYEKGYQPDWQPVAANNGQVYYLDRNFLRELGGLLAADVYIGEGEKPGNVSLGDYRMHVMLFDCAGHIGVLGSDRDLAYAPPRSVGAALAAIACKSKKD